MRHCNPYAFYKLLVPGSHARIQEVLSGGGVHAQRQKNGLDNVFLVLNVFYSLQRGFNGLIQRKLYCSRIERSSSIFQGGGPTFSRGGPKC